jgi:hypothetical protein
MINTREFYSSSNGDKWFLRHDHDEDHTYVKRVANSASGGHQTNYELYDFLHGPRTPERAALIKLIASLTEMAFAEE